MKILFLIFLIFIYGCSQIIDSTELKETLYKDITSEELKEMLDKGEDMLLVDVHIPEQRHMKGTDIFIPYNEIGNNLGLLPKNKDAKIVLYCRSGSMSREAAQKLADLGYKNVYNHLGGTIDWRNKGFDFE